jgi:stage III sporulation protein AB
MRKNFFENYISFLEFTKAQISFTSVAFLNILEKFSPKDDFAIFFNHLKEELKQKKETSIAWEKTILENKNIFGLKKSDISTICEFGKEIGTTDTKNQLNLCDTHIHFAKEYLRDATIQKKQSSRLYVSLGIWSGLAISLLFF